MDAEIAVEWMGEVLKALVQWFRNPVKDLSDLPDAAPQTFTVDNAETIWAQIVNDGDNANFRQYPTVRPMNQPIYDNEGVTVGQPTTMIFTTDGTVAPNVVTVRYGNTIRAEIRETAYMAGTLQATI
jgi:hypothetical protein